MTISILPLCVGVDEIHMFDGYTMFVGWIAPWFMLHEPPFFLVKSQFVMLYIKHRCWCLKHHLLRVYQEFPFHSSVPDLAGPGQEVTQDRIRRGGG